MKRRETKRRRRRTSSTIVGKSFEQRRAEEMKEILRLTVSAVANLRCCNYFICDNQHMNGLQEAVARMLPSGWVPTGGVVVRPDGWFYQAMVRYAE